METRNICFKSNVFFITATHTFQKVLFHCWLVNSLWVFALISMLEINNRSQNPNFSLAPGGCQMVANQSLGLEPKATSAEIKKKYGAVIEFNRVI